MTARGRIIYLNLLAADQHQELRRAGRRPPTEYELACRFMRCGVIDRTGTTPESRTVHRILDQIPPSPSDVGRFGDICDSVGAEIVEAALAADRQISVLWSGGIDSTTALIAVLKAAANAGCQERVQVMVSIDSVREYPAFYLRHLHGRYRLAPVQPPISEFIDPACLNVTGELGDQLFGSHLLEMYARVGLARQHFRDMLRIMIGRSVRNPRNITRLIEYLNPVIDACPVPIASLFDCLWWLNFTLKWQDVTLRLPALRGGEARPVFDSLWHFFRDQRFQQWSIANVEERTPADWTRYKQSSKQYILAYTGDKLYYQTKEKVDSLRNVMSGSEAGPAYKIVMREDFIPIYTKVDLPEPSRLASWAMRRVKERQQ